jgi:hypothetical protein
LFSAWGDRAVGRGGAGVELVEGEPAVGGVAVQGVDDALPVGVAGADPRLHPGLRSGRTSQVSCNGRLVGRPAKLRLYGVRSGT